MVFLSKVLGIIQKRVARCLTIGNSAYGLKIVSVTNGRTENVSCHTRSDRESFVSLWMITTISLS